MFQLWLSDGSESADRAGTCSALLPSWIFGEQNRKIQQRHKQPGTKKLQKKKKDPQTLKSLRKMTTPHASPNFSTTVPK
jgi:hypothetical protein